MKYCFFFRSSSSQKVAYHASRRFPLWKNTIIPQDSSRGEMSWHMLTKYVSENRQSPLAKGFPLESLRQKGVLVNMKLLTALVLSWLSMMIFLAVEMLVKAIVLETARGAAHMTCLHLYFLITLLSVSATIVMEPWARLSIVMTWWLSLRILLNGRFSLFSILFTKPWTNRSVPPLIR